MKLKRRHKETAEVSTESLNDIMFFLLLFFLIVSTMANPSVLKLTLPSTDSGAVVQKKPIIVEVDANHQYAINKTIIPFADFENALKIEMEKIKDSTPTIVLKFDSSLTIQDLADIMQLGAKYGVKMVLQTKATTK